MAIKRYLLVNSCFSFFCGILMLLLPEQFNSFFESSSPLIFTIIGINLMSFSVFVLFVALSKPIRLFLIQLIIILDVLWVIASLLLLLFTIGNLSTNGYIMIGLIAVFIGFLAFKQYQNYPAKEI